MIVQEGKPLVLNVVKKAEQHLINDRSRVKEYLPVVGLAEFNKFSAKVIFGADSPEVLENRVTTVHCLSGTGSLRFFGYTLSPGVTLILGLDFQGLLEDLGSAPSGAIVLLHALPTRVANGSLDVDAQLVRLFVADGGECVVAQCYAKNMGLYGECVRALSICSWTVQRYTR
ncbi:hypothetical protein MLD38_007050 [Melastoma candidum]|uniref:Uncharacterized protein n=1 Tax=Melastoma candidum TaxID=119954 RepID=A0ACB9RYD5_9MYRT|nr:hypothetical protein MLD38_007050 [Melastoma candidum]